MVGMTGSKDLIKLKCDLVVSSAPTKKDGLCEATLIMGSDQYVILVPEKEYKNIQTKHINAARKL